MLELKQPYYDHLVIQSKKLLIFFNKKGKLGEQVVEKRVLRRQTKKRTTVCVDQYCSKINRESEVQTEQFNKEDCQESSAENYWSFEHNGGDTWPGWDGRHSSERKYLCWAKSKVMPVWDSPRNTRNWQQRIGTTFLFTDECPKYLFQCPNPKTISFGARGNVMFLWTAFQNAKVMVWCGITGHGLTKLHMMLPTGQTSASKYYINLTLRKKWNR